MEVCHLFSFYATLRLCNVASMPLIYIVTLYHNNGATRDVVIISLLLGSFTWAIALGILFAVSVIINIILVLMVVVQQYHSKQKSIQPGN